jgi:DNA-binding beta-propeller fold protein YncE
MMTRSSRCLSFAVLLVILVVAAGVGVASALAHSTRAAGAGFDGRIAGQPDFRQVGNATYRFRPGLREYEVRRPNQAPGFFHLDLEPTQAAAFTEEVALDGEGGSTALPGSELSPVCRSSGNRIVVVYTHRASDGTPTPTATLRSIVKRMNWKIADQASQSSAGKRPVNMAVDCDGEGQINVYNVATADNNFASLTASVAGSIFGTPSGGGAVKYLIFDHSPASQTSEGLIVAGIGGPVIDDATKSRSNENARHTQYALVYNYQSTWETHVTIHELMHALGATQGHVEPKFPGEYPNAPNSSPGHHCSDGLDILCYKEPGWFYFSDYCSEFEGYKTPVTIPIDCGKDTYFNAAPPAGEWLAEFWDIAGHEDPFLVVPAAKPVITNEPVSSIGESEASLNATINPSSNETMYWFEYGKSLAYNRSIPLYDEEPDPWTEAALAGKILSGGSGVKVTEKIKNLEPHVTYHFRVVAENDGGRQYGQDRTFTTSGTGKSVSPTYAFSVGSLGSGNGQFNLVEGGIAFDNAGHFWAVDQRNDRVEEFNSEGKYLSQFGGYGAGNGQFQEPTGMAIDPAGNIWVADQVNNRIQKFNSEGKYLSQFGSEGSGNGQLKQPGALAIDPTGNLWVSDLGNNRVEKFNSEGKYLTQFGSKGSGNGQFIRPAGIAFDPADGSAWVADGGNNRIQKFNSEGKYLSQFGTEGSGDGQLNGPRAIAIGPEGNLWITDRGNRRVDGFTPEGKYVGKFGTEGSGPGQFGYGLGYLAFDADGELWIGDTVNNRVEKWMFTPPHIPPTYAFSVGSAGSGNGQFNLVEGGIAFDNAGHFWAVDHGNNRIQKFNSEGKYLSQFGSYGTGNGQFQQPAGMAIDPAGSIWVADQHGNRVEKFNSEGKYLSQFGSFGTGSGQFDQPTALAIDPAGNLWVSDLGNDRVEKFNSEGKYLTQFGSEGSGNGQFIRPAGIAFDPADGSAWVADGGNNRIQKFNSEGKYLSQFGSKGSGNGQLSGPRAIAFGPEGNLWITDRANRRVDGFTPEGKYVGKFGTEGSGPGQFGLALGYLAFDSDGELWIGDTVNNRVEKWVFWP